MLVLKTLCVIISKIINFGEVDFENIMLDRKSNENISIYNTSYKTLIGAKPLRVRFTKIDGSEFMMELNIQYYLVVKSMRCYLL